jgi:hypothetical protein
MNNFQNWGDTISWLLSDKIRAVKNCSIGNCRQLQITMVEELEISTPLMPKADHLTQSWFTAIHLQSSRTVSIISTLMLSSHLLLCIHSILIKILRIFLASPIIAMCRGHISLLNFNIIISYLYKSLSTPLYNILSFAITSSFLRLNIFLDILFKNKLCSSFEVIKLYSFNL